MPNNKQGSHDQGQQNAQSQGERGGYGNTSRNAGGSQQGGQGQRHRQQGQQSMGGSQQGNKRSSEMNAEDDET